MSPSGKPIFLNKYHILSYIWAEADPGGRTIKDVGLRPLAYWDSGFESRWRHG